MSVTDVVVYTRAGCHLCHDAEQILMSYGLRPLLVDIDENPGLLARYNDSIPVVEIDGVVRFCGRIDEVLLRRLLQGANRG